MRKSPLANIGANTQKPTRVRRKSNVFDLELLKPKMKLYNGTILSIDFPLLYKSGCKEDGELVESRAAPIMKLARAFDGLIKDGKSQDTLKSLFDALKTYIVFCDINSIDPFTKQGYSAYFGNAGEVRRLVGLANKPLPYLFMYEDGQEMGISESTVVSLTASIKFMLQTCGVYHPSWQSGIETIKYSNPNYTAPYTTNSDGTGELDKTLRRLQFYFFSLSSQLIAFKKSNPNIPQPTSLIAIVDEDSNGKSIEILVNQGKTGNQTDKAVSVSMPFNRAMQAGYYLFAYYTSFNDSSILDIRHPIEVITDKKDGRTIRHSTVRGFKGRSNKSVSSLFSDFNADDIPEADDDVAGYVTAQVDKKDGLSFIKALSELSTLYKGSPHGRLFYQLTNGGEPENFGRYSSASYLSAELGLYVDSKRNTKDHLIKAFYLALNEYKEFEITMPNDGKLGRTLSKKILPIGKASRTQKLSIYIYAAIRSMTDVGLKNILMPITYSDVNSNGKVTLSFSYLNGTKGEIKIESKYVSFFKDVEAYSLTRNPIYGSKYHPNNKHKPAYLITKGGRLNTKQWDGLELINYLPLKLIGIRSGDFFLDLNAKRFRATTSNNYYDPNDSGYSLSKHILQHTMNVLHDRYANGHPEQNNLIVSQSLQVIEEWARTKDIDEAISSVKAKLKITVLEHEEWKALRMPTNINGVLCNGEPEIDGKNYHRDAKRFAKKLLDDESGSISCYQFDMCVYCKSAKLVDDTQAAYKFLSFVELLEEAVDRMPTQASRLAEKALYFKLIAEQNFSLNVLEEAEEKVMNEGRYPLLNDDFIYAMNGVDNA